MYAKVFTQIFDSSIAEDYEVRHVFEDLLKLADKDGNVDMTMEAIARRTNVPIDIVKKGLDALSSPDPESRTRDFEGRRIVLIDPNRSWGWFIVNYEHYRNIQDEEMRKEAFRKAKQKQRDKEKAKNATKIKGCNLPKPPPDEEPEVGDAA